MGLVRFKGSHRDFSRPGALAYKVRTTKTSQKSFESHCIKRKEK